MVRWYVPGGCAAHARGAPQCTRVISSGGGLRASRRATRHLVLLSTLSLPITSPSLRLGALIARSRLRTGDEGPIGRGERPKLWASLPHLWREERARVAGEPAALPLMHGERERA